MALVTIQRSPSNSNSISSSSDSGGNGKEEENQKSCKSLSECYFAGKGTALMLGSNERLQPIYDGRNIFSISNELSASQTSIGSVGSDIQQHLQSMFYLLRPEETLKMAVKLESLRAGRTRYLVVVSRSVSKNPQQSTLNRFNASPNRNQSPFLPKNIPSYSNTEEISNNNKQSEINHNISTSCLKKISTNDESSFAANDQKMEQGISHCNDSLRNLIQYSNKDQSCDNDQSIIENNCSGKNSSNDIEESCLLGIDCNEKTTVGMVLKILADTTIRLDGDGGFSVSVCGRQHIFKPVSVQAMWSALQTLYKISSKAHEHNFFSGGPSHDWVQYYEDRIESDRSCLNEWHAMDSLESRRPPSPDTIRNKPAERDETERVIRTALKEIMMSVDLDEVTSKYIRSKLEEHLDMDLGEFKSFIDEEMLVILGQMDAPTEIFEHVYLGSEWNASNLEELQRNGVGHILNVTREIDNFFPGMFDYFNVRVYDDEKTDLLKHWDNTFKYISRAKTEGSKVLVHCKMGISRSASVVVAYAMKAYNWDFHKAIQHVKEKRSCIKPNKNFLAQLETYQGILDAMKNKEKLQRSKSETSLKSENVKDGKSLPGSEPTPLIQALQRRKNSTYPSSKREILYLKCKSHRPNSSPDISKSSSETLSFSKPHSISLETIVVQDVTKIPEQQTNNTETTNLRWPCKNGHYSVTQNKIIYLENESTKNLTIMDQKQTSDSAIKDSVPLVRSIITELEQHNEKLKDKEYNQEMENDHKIKSDIQQVLYTCSAGVIHQSSIDISKITKFLQTPCVIKKEDSFSKQVDRIFDREENRFNKLEPIRDAPQQFISRQSSWSSVDSACIIGDLPSRNSSWGSGDNNRPSRNSSWGSYDTAKLIQKQAILNEEVVMGHSGIFPCEKYEIHPWHPGTVKRTKQKIEEKKCLPLSFANDAKNNNNNNNNKILCDIKRSLLIDNLSIRTNNRSFVQSHKFAKLQQSSSTGIIKCSKTHTRCKSEEYLTAQKEIHLRHDDKNDNNNNNQLLLSASAPENKYINLISNDCSMMNRKQKAYVTNECNERKKVTKEHQRMGKVKNLKMNFEAKASSCTENVLNSRENRKNSHSLPSSPISVHIDLASAESGFTGSSDISSEDINVRGLVDRYEVEKMGTYIPPNVKQRPKSLYESKIQTKTFQPKQQPLMISHQTILAKSDDFKQRPPIPFQQPIVKNALMTSNQNFLCSTKHQVTSCKKMQQGKTHPLSKLGVNKRNYTNPTTAYNTM